VERARAAFVQRARAFCEQPVLVLLDPVAERRSRRHLGVARNRKHGVAPRQPPADLGSELRCISAGAAGLRAARARGEEPVDVPLDPAAQRLSRRHCGIARDRAHRLAAREPPADGRGERFRIADPASHGMKQATFDARNFARAIITAAFRLPCMRDVL